MGYVVVVLVCILCLRGWANGSVLCVRCCVCRVCYSFFKVSRTNTPMTFRKRKKRQQTTTHRKETNRKTTQDRKPNTPIPLTKTAKHTTKKNIPLKSRNMTHNRQNIPQKPQHTTHKKTYHSSTSLPPHHARVTTVAPAATPVSCQRVTQERSSALCAANRGRTCFRTAMMIQQETPVITRRTAMCIAM